MGLFNIFKKNEVETKKKEIIIYSPLKGKAIDLTEVPDDAFAQKMIGDGIAIDPYEGVICSPIDGELANIFPTKHALMFESKDGLEIIVHFGVDTVKLEGKGFEILRKEGKISKSEEILKYDLEYIKEHAVSTKTPIIVANMDIVDSIEILAKDKEVNIGDPIYKVTLK